MKFFIEQIDGGNSNLIRVGEAETLQQAIAIAKGIIDEYLNCQNHDNKSADALYTKFQESGPIPCIFSGAREALNVHAFDPWDYASLKSLELCKYDHASVFFIASSAQKESDNAREKFRHPLSGVEFYPSLFAKSDPSETLDLRTSLQSNA